MFFTIGIIEDFIKRLAFVSHKSQKHFFLTLWRIRFSPSNWECLSYFLALKFNESRVFVVNNSDQKPRLV